MTKVIFHPQAWIRDYAVEVDLEGPNSWYVEDDAVKGLEDDSYESDELRFTPGAPDWVRDWHGPFWIEIERTEL